MKTHTVLITGANGGIGTELCRTFKNSGWRVIGSDITAPRTSISDEFIPLDLDKYCQNESYRVEIDSRLREKCIDENLNAIINNAAIQIVSPIEKLHPDDWHQTFNINVVAPFLLVQNLLPELEKTNGCVINISSIHAKLTKPGFCAYATSKAALIGLTQSMAVELGNRIRVNAICPAAISTPMLEAGFKGNQKARESLLAHHPSQSIGSPQEVSEAALFLANATGQFLNGSVIDIDGGIGFRLHDPA